MYDVAILGAGFSGTIAAVQLAKQSVNTVKIVLIDKSNSFGEGMAYGTKRAEHLLNVPANKMSAFETAPEHFVEWLLQNAPEYLKQEGPGSYVPRVVYGDYLKSILSEYDVDLIGQEVCDLTQSSDGVRIAFKDGKEISAKKVIWALGNFAPANPYMGEGSKDLYESPLYIQSPWSSDFLDTINGDEDILFIGSGLTAVDQMVSLYDQGHEGKIYAFSRRGYLSQYHQAHNPSRDYILEDALIKPTLMELYKKVRSEIQNCEDSQRDWRGVTDAIRPHTFDIWGEFSLKDKQRFMRHLRSLWDVHRHRIAPESARKIQAMIDTGQLINDGGRAQSIEVSDEGIRLTYSQRKSSEEKTITANLVVNCTGPARRLDKSTMPLVQNALSKGYIKPDETGLGFISDDKGHVHGDIYTLGISKIGLLWESKTVREIRVQAEDLAKELLSQLHQKAA